MLSASSTARARAKTPSPVYQVRFKNRSTVWTYLDKQTGAVTSTEADPLPLTHFGNAGTKQKPSRGRSGARTATRSPVSSRTSTSRRSSTG